MNLLAIAAALIAGAAAGVAVGMFLARRSRVGWQPSADIATPGSVPRREGGDGEVAVGLRSAVDRLAMGVVVCDDSCKPTYRNDVAEALHGTQAGVIVDHHLQQIFEAASVEGSTGRIVELQGPPKVTFSIDARAVPGGGAVATIEDITERVRIDSIRTDFVANISHELKTPVGALAVLAEMLIDESDLDVVSNLSVRVVEEAHRAVRTIDDLLELSRIESSLQMDDIVDLHRLIDEAIERGRNFTATNNVTISAIAAPRDVHIRADRLQLVSAIGNLVENGVKYSNDDGSVQIRTRVGERWVEVMVADQGAGIPAGDLDRIFERFYRVDKARARDSGGTGLGLSIVRRVMRNHGGDVSVSSHEGEGSTFVLRLPVRLIVEPHAAPREAVSS